MPFRKTRFSRRRRPRSSFRRRGRMSTRAIAVKALRSTDQEQKFVDTVMNDQAINDTLTVQTFIPLNNIAQGASNSTRIGQKIRMTSVYLQLIFEKLPADVSPNGFVRFMIIYDRQTNSALPNWATLLELPGTGTPVVEMMSPNNLDQSKRYRVLLDRRLYFSDDFIEGRIVTKFMKLGQTVQYDGIGASIADISTGSLLFAATGHITTGGNAPTVSGVIRVRYVG